MYAQLILNGTMNNRIPSQFGFYAILTDPLKGYEYCTKLCVDYNIAFVQLRIKDGPIDSIYTIAESMKKITEGSSTSLIINDHPAIALDIGADGVHIGQTDAPYAEVRQSVGSKMIIGISTHSPQQASQACTLQPDYIGTGPVYPTPTKKIADPVIGTDGLSAILDCATVPAVAIGGIDLDNFRDILETKAVNFCMMRQFTQSLEPERILKTIRTIYNEYYPDFY